MKIALLAPFDGFAPSYSLATVVCEQARALRSVGCEVEVWCFTTAGGGTGRSSIPEDLVDVIKPCIKPQKFEVDVVDGKRSASYAADIGAALDKFKPDAVITHDALLQKHYIDVGKAIHDIVDLYKSVLWFHWLHSYIGPTVEEATAGSIYRLSVPIGHFLVYPNSVDAKNVIARYRTEEMWVLSCPNPRDARTVWSVSPLTKKLVTGLSLMMRDVVQVYPICMTRAESKGLSAVVRVFEAFKRRGKKVCLLVCNANAGGEKERRKIDEVRGETTLGIDELVFTSELVEGMETSGVPSEVVGELLLFSNLFFFPTMAEAGPLVLAEAQMAGCYCVVNGNVPGLVEYTETGTLRPEFPAHGKSVEYRKTTGEGGEVAYESFIDELAGKMLVGIGSNMCLMQKRSAMKRHSWEEVGGRLLDLMALAESRKKRYVIK